MPRARPITLLSKFLGCGNSFSRSLESQKEVFQMTFMISSCSRSSWTGRAGSQSPEGFYLFIQNKSIIGNDSSITTLPSQDQEPSMVNLPYKLGGWVNWRPKIKVLRDCLKTHWKKVMRDEVQKRKEKKNPGLFLFSGNTWSSSLNNNLGWFSTCFSRDLICSVEQLECNNWKTIPLWTPR